jgi:hypothetical protein
LFLGQLYNSGTNRIFSSGTICYSYWFCILVFSDELTSSVDLCNLYCQIQFYSGKLCNPGTVTTTASSTTVETTVASTNTTSTIPTGSDPCPDSYVTDPAQPLLCALWMELQSVESIYISGTSFITPVLEFTQCLYR